MWAIKSVFLVYDFIDLKKYKVNLLIFRIPALFTEKFLIMIMFWAEYNHRVDHFTINKKWNLFHQDIYR